MVEEFRSISSTTKDIQNFSRVVGGVLVLFGFWVPMLFIAGGGLLLLGVFVPRVLLPIQRAWMMMVIISPIHVGCIVD